MSARKLTDAELRLPIEEWADGLLELTPEDAIMAIVNGDHEDAALCDELTSAFTIMLLQHGLLACARAPGNKLAFQPTVHAYIHAGWLN